MKKIALSCWSVACEIGFMSCGNLTGVWVSERVVMTLGGSVSVTGK